LGYGDSDTIGDTELPSSVGDVSVTNDTRKVVQISCGTLHTCVLLDNGAVKCWGFGANGRLGYGNTTFNIGDDEFPSDVGDVSVTSDNRTVVQISCGDSHTCVLLDDGAVKCWGFGDNGRLGYGNNITIGDDELPSSVGDVSVTNDNRTVVQISCGLFHTCVLLNDGAVKCWGVGDSGQLGYGDTDTIGDDELPSSVGDVAVTNDTRIVVQISCGFGHTCVILDDGAVKCWGLGGDGELGYGNTDDIGDNEEPSTVGDASVVDFSIDENHCGTCDNACNESTSICTGGMCVSPAPTMSPTMSPTPDSRRRDFCTDTSQGK
jgi:alpha-tubulin suppressor-like RCC1 family protein